MSVVMKIMKRKKSVFIADCKRKGNNTPFYVFIKRALSIIEALLMGKK